LKEAIMADSKEITIFQVDSFTDRVFKGNPAGVCVLEEPLDDQTMHDIAAEMNLSETAFAVKITAGPMVDAYKFNLRWFTPKCEVDLCGHATLATARILHDIYELKNDKLTFTSRSGDLPVTRKGDFHQLDFPAGDPQHVKLPDYMISALNLYDTGLDELLQETLQCRKSKKLLLRFKDKRAVYEAAPDFSQLMQAEAAFGSVGTIFTAMGDQPYDFISRFFAPFYGISEDPVTGAAHTVLSPYWAGMLDKRKMLAYQASKRGGELIVEMKKDPKGHRHRVLISGKSVIVMHGVMKI
jgi:PhzF family phenazine biosynthesis protein